MRRGLAGDAKSWGGAPCRRRGRREVNVTPEQRASGRPVQPEGLRCVGLYFSDRPTPWRDTPGRAYACGGPSRRAPRRDRQISGGSHAPSVASGASLSLREPVTRVSTGHGRVRLTSTCSPCRAPGGTGRLSSDGACAHADLGGSRRPRACHSGS